MAVFLAFSTAFGLPAHVLLVHAAVVLVPLAALALVATGWRSAWRESYAGPIALMAVAGAVFAFLAKQSGEPLKNDIRQAARAAGQAANFGEHPENGDTAFVFAMLFGLTALGLWLATRYRERLGLPTWAPMAAYGLGVGAAVIATLTMVIAGHSGATLAWNDLGTFAAGG